LHGINIHKLYLAYCVVIDDWGIMACCAEIPYVQINKELNTVCCHMCMNIIRLGISGGVGFV
jgi:hypothetical protein